MARQVDPGDVPIRHPKAKYPWHEWTNGSWWLARSGEDFTCHYDAFRSALYVRARRMGLKVVTRSMEDGIVFRFTR